jgi:hypothetical protein
MSEGFMDGAERICPGSVNVGTTRDLEPDEILWRSVGLSAEVAVGVANAAQALDRFVAACEDEYATDVPQATQELRLALFRLLSIPTVSREDFREKRRFERRLCASLDAVDQIAFDFRHGLSKETGKLLDQLAAGPLTMSA